MTLDELASQITAATGISGADGRRSLRRLEAKANLRGFNSKAPAHLQTPVEDGFTISGKSRLVRHTPAGAETVVEWVKTQKDRARQEELLRAFIEGLTKDIKPARRRKAPTGRGMSATLMPAICIGDAHIGMRAFGEETKHADFDTKIATEQLRDAFHYLTDRAPAAKQALFINVGDLIHANAQSGETAAGTRVDVDTRHHATLRAAAECMAYGIDLQLQKHRRVTVVMARGNHDPDAGAAVQLMLEFYYRNEPRVTVLPSHGYVHYVEWHANLLGIHHGDKMKPEKFASVMARDMPEAWGRTSYRMLLTGHFHKDAVKTLDGVRHKICAALPPPDSWHASHGFAGDGEMEMLIFRKTGGIHASIVYNVPQPRISPDAVLK